MKKNKLFKVAGVVAVVGIISFLSVSLITTKVDAAKQAEQVKVQAELQAIANSAKDKYKADTIIGTQEVEKVYIAIRKQDDNSVLASLYIDGLWVEIGKIGVMAEDGTP